LQPREKVNQTLFYLQVTQIEKFDECKASASWSKPDEHCWLDGYICSLCGFELPPCFEEERQEHSDFHLAEMLQKEDAVDSIAHLSKERYFSIATCLIFMFHNSGTI
jgi:Ca2+-transporting ATPase/DNA polymerase kappa